MPLLNASMIVSGVAGAAVGVAFLFTHRPRRAVALVWCGVIMAVAAEAMLVAALITRG